MADQTTIHRVQNDTSPDEVFPITRAGVVVNLTGYVSVKFYIKSLLTNSVTNAAHTTCTVTDAVNGIVSYSFLTGDLPDPGGDYECDLQLNPAAGKTETYYSVIRIKTRAQRTS